MNNGMMLLVVGLGLLWMLSRNGKAPYNPALPGQSGGITEGTGEVLFEGMEF